MHTSSRWWQARAVRKSICRRVPIIGIRRLQQRRGDAATCAISMGEPKRAGVAKVIFKGLTETLMLHSLTVATHERGSRSDVSARDLDTLRRLRKRLGREGYIDALQSVSAEPERSNREPGAPPQQKVRQSFYAALYLIGNHQRMSTSPLRGRSVKWSPFNSRVGLQTEDPTTKPTNRRGLSNKTYAGVECERREVNRDDDWRPVILAIQLRRPEVGFCGVPDAAASH